MEGTQHQSVGIAWCCLQKHIKQKMLATTLRIFDKLPAGVRWHSRCTGCILEQLEVPVLSESKGTEIAIARCTNELSHKGANA
eukprot:345913-Amphidinium_carterae.1